MKILILSDSHEAKIDLNLSKYDYVFHAGDYGLSYDYLNDNNVYFVRGNCDFYGDKDRLEIINDKRIYITHGDLYRVKYQLSTIYYRGKETEADLVIFGHTHTPYYSVDDGITFINPGSYSSGRYVEIIDDEIIFYLDNEVVHKYNNSLFEVTK